MKRVLFSATVTRHIIRFHIPYLRWFKEHGWETWVAAKDDSLDGEGEIPFCDNIVNIDFDRSPFSKQTIVAYHQLRKLFADNSFNLIHTHTPVGGVLTRFAARNARQRGAKIVYTAHGFHFYKGAPVINWMMWYPVERAMSHFTDLLITINHEDYERAKRFAHCSVKYIPGVGINLSRFRQDVDFGSIRRAMDVGEDDFLILGVGDLNANKNHRLTISALADLPQTCKLAICGTGPERDRLEKLAYDFGVQDRVHFLGYRHDVPELMASANCLAFPSMREGLPVSIMEAMAAGLPIIASSIRGIDPDLIQNQKNGLLLKSNSVEEMVQSISLLMNDRDLCSRLASQARSDVLRFESSNLVSSMVDAYTEILS